MSNILEIKDLCKHYESFSLDNVSFSVPRGYIMGFVGPNGSGKTTTIKSILNMVYPDSGEISIFGMKTSPDSPEIKDDIGVVMDLPFYVDDWKVKDIEAAVSPFYSRWNKTVFNEFLNRFNLSKNKKIKELSRGMKVKIMLAVAMSHDAKLLILDEPTSGLDPVARDELMEILGEFIIDENKGVLFSTHITADLEKIADYITFIIDGRVEFTGEKDQLIEGYMLVKGDSRNITPELKKNIIGFREHSVGFEGMVETKHAKKLPPQISCEKISLDEIIIYMSKEAKKHE